MQNTDDDPNPAPHPVSLPIKLDSIQFLSALAAMLVVVYHAQLDFSLNISKPSFVGESYLFAFGAVGVHIFFVISGFIMVFASKFEPKFDAKAFFRRRILRIYPIYWICAALYLSFHALMSITYELTVREYFGAIFLLPDYSSKIIGPGWTLAFELFFYFCFGVSMLAGLNRGLLLLTVVFFGLVAVGLILPFENQLWNFLTNTLLMEFLAGSAVGWLFIRGYLPKSLGFTFLMGALILFSFGIGYGYDGLPSALMWGVPSVLLVAGCVSIEASRVIPDWVSKIGHFGDSSYALYLIHILLITITVQLFSRLSIPLAPPPAVLAVFVAIIALICSELLHHRIEKPLLSWLYVRRQKGTPVSGANTRSIV